MGQLLRDEEAGIATAINLPPGLGAFMAQVKELRGWLNEMRDKTTLMQAKSRRIQGKLGKEDVGDEGVRLRAVINEACKDALRMQNRLEALKHDNDRIERELLEHPDPAAEGELRIRKNHAALLSKQFVDVMRESREVQEEIKKGLSENLAQQVQLLDPELSDENAQSLTCEEQVTNSQALLRRELSRSLSRKGGLQALAYVKRRHDDIRAIAKGVEELAQTFVDAAILLQMQGELINNIVDNCATARDYVVSANRNVKRSSKLKKKHRFKVTFLSITICVIVTLVVVLLLSILLPIIIKSAEFAVV